MTTKEKARNGANRASQQGKTSSRDSIPLDPLRGWFSLAKHSRDRQPKRSYKRGKQRGRIDAYLAAQLALLIVLVLLVGGGVMR